jgi:hypothetical protein
MRDEERQVEPFKREECIGILECVSEMDQELLELLDLPPVLFRFGDELSYAFSSSPDQGIGVVFQHLFFAMPWNPDFADYGIYLVPRGSHVFCLLVDRRRKIIVCEQVNSMYAMQGDWEEFKVSLRATLDQAKDMLAGNQEFEFVVTKDGIVNTIPV